MKLIVLRGNAGSGKSTVARLLRERLGEGVALVEQDYLRRGVLGARETNDGANTDLIELVARYALTASPAVVLDGILSRDRYTSLLATLASIDGVDSWFYYFDIPFEVTVVRHASRDKAGSFGADELRRWYVERDLLDGIDERLVDSSSSAAETASRIIAEAGLDVTRQL
ncbi:AAA family ATPase [Leifsonia poae]|uniref:AAA family ATPase n=1 Tax=Leifsonia poae TaxID=110933 RepID=UPI001CBF6CCA|nr:AAA family ATPase [Leifsonia poae]